MALPILTVVAALGRQGSSLITALQSDSEAKYHIRALTSNAASPSAAKIAAMPNVEVIQVDVNSLQSLRSAFHGTTYLFGNTVFSAETLITQGPEAAERLEASHGVNIAKAAAATPSLRHFIWSTLHNVKKQTGGKFHIPHFQAKVDADDYILKNPDLLAKTTFLRVGFYESNIARIPYKPIFLEEANAYILLQPCSPDTLIPFAGNEAVNTGIVSKAIIEQPRKTQGQIVTAITRPVTAKQWAANLEKAIRQKGDNAKVAYVGCTLEEYVHTWGSIGLEIGLMMQYFEQDETGKGFEWCDQGRGLVTPEDLGVHEQLVSVQDSLTWF